MPRRKLGDQLIEAMQEVLAYSRGEKTGLRVTEFPDVKSARERLGLSQGQFARTFEISLPTLQKWEQRKRLPTGPARALIRIIEAEPEAAKRALKIGATPARRRVTAKTAKPAGGGRASPAR